MCRCMVSCGGGAWCGLCGGGWLGLGVWGRGIVWGGVYVHSLVCGWGRACYMEIMFQIWSRSIFQIWSRCMLCNTTTMYTISTLGLMIFIQAAVSYFM